jgi:hypothetical protein
MMGATNIEWTDLTVNPFRARNRETGRRGHVCIKVGPECLGCYAEAWQFHFTSGRPSDAI